MNGGRTQVSAALTPHAQPSELAVRVELEALRRQSETANAALGNPAPVPDSLDSELYVDATYLPLDVGFVGGAPDVVLTTFTDVNEDDVPMVDGGYDLDVRYGSPYPSRWNELAVLSHEYSVVTPVTLADGGVLRRELPVRSHVVEDARRFHPDGGAAPTLGPVLAPPREVLLDGQPFLAAVPHPATFTLHVTPATTGAAPELYEVRAYRVSAHPELPDLEAESAAVLTSRSTDLSFPPGALLPGESYVLRVTSFALPTTWREGTPLEYGTPMAFVDVLVGPVRIAR